MKTTSKKLQKVLLGLCLVTVTTGSHCREWLAELDDDDDHETRRTRASIVATAHDEGETVVRATLHTETGDVELKELEALTAASTPAAGGPSSAQAFSVLRTPFGSRYESTLAGIERDTLIEVTLDRSATEGVVARNSYASLPARFSLGWVVSPTTEEPAPLDFSRSDPAGRYVIWDPHGTGAFEEGDELFFSVTGDCIEPLEGEVDWQRGEDSLELTNTLVDREGIEGGTCVVDVELMLRRRGVVDSAFEGGRFVAQQVRQLRVLARP